MKTQSSAIGQVIVVRMNNGEDILQSIRQAVAQHDIKHALILGAMGSVTTYHVHVVEDAAMPPHDRFLKGDIPLDILSMNGVVMDGRVHAHISFYGLDLAVGGHLEEGCQVHTFCQVWLITAPDTDLSNWDRIGIIE